METKNGNTKTKPSYMNDDAAHNATEKTTTLDNESTPDAATNTAATATATATSISDIAPDVHLLS